MAEIDTSTGKYKFYSGRTELNIEKISETQIMDYIRYLHSQTTLALWSFK